jgi:DnaA N-terminal domain
MEKAPSYPRYPKQILGDDKVLAMDWDAYGMHEWLMSLSWQQEPRGTLPADSNLLRRWLRNPSDEVWRRAYPQLLTVWVECGKLTDVDAKTGEFIFPEDIRQLGSTRLANKGMVRTSIKKQNYIVGNSLPKGIVKEQSQTSRKHKRKYSRKQTEDVNKESSSFISSSPEKVEVRLSLELFDFETFVHNMQAAYVNRDKYAPGAEEACCSEIEWLITQPGYTDKTRQQLAEFILEQTKTAVDLMKRYRPADKWPSLYTYMSKHQYLNETETWGTPSREEIRDIKLRADMSVGSAENFRPRVEQPKPPVKPPRTARVFAPSPKTNEFVAGLPAGCDPWKWVLQKLEPQINRTSFETWLKPTRFAGIDGTDLVVRVPNDEFCHIGERFGELINQALTGTPFECVDFEAA